MSKRYLRFSIRVLIFLIALFALPCWWLASEMAQYRKELAAIDHIREHAPHLYVEHRYCGPSWMWKVGFRPDWLQRVGSIDVTGQTGGKNHNMFMFEFDDAAFAAIYDDLLVFEHLSELYLQFTKLTDASLPALGTFSRVKFINLQQTQMTSAAVRDFDQDRTDIKVAFFYDLSVPDGDPGDRARSQ